MRHHREDQAEAYPVIEGDGQAGDIQGGRTTMSTGGEDNS